MKRLFVIALSMMLVSNLLSQVTESSKMEERAREFVRIISQPEAVEWKAFILENYTPAFREKPVKVNIQTSGAPTKIYDNDRTSGPDGIKDFHVRAFPQAVRKW